MRIMNIQYQWEYYTCTGTTVSNTDVPLLYHWPAPLFIIFALIFGFIWCGIAIANAN